MITCLRPGLLTFGLFIGLSVGSFGTKAQPKPVTTANRAAIRESDLKRDRFALADDHFRGRRAGALDELRASAYIAEQLREWLATSR